MPLLGRMGRPGLIGMAARTAVVAGTATAVSGAVGRHQQQRAAEQSAYAQAQAPAAPPVAAAPVADPFAQLRQLAALHTQGVLPDAEFAAAVHRLLEG